MSVQPITQRVRNNIIRILTDAYPEALPTSEVLAQLIKYYGCNHTFRRTHDHNAPAYLPHGCTTGSESGCTRTCWQAQAYPNLRALVTLGSVEYFRALIPVRGAYWCYQPDPDPDVNGPEPEPRPDHPATQFDTDPAELSYRPDIIDLDAPPDTEARVIDAHDRFTRAPQHPCRECGQPASIYVLPNVDHRRRQPWPQPYWLCDIHAETSTTPGAQQ